MNTRLSFKISISIMILYLLLGACGPSASIEKSNPASVAKSNLKRMTSPITTPDDIQSLVKNNNEFAFDLYGSLRTQSGNLIYSPYSISLALAMTFAGARGETESQMAHVMHFLPQDHIHPAFNALDLQLAERGKTKSKEEIPLQLNIANAIWAEQTYPFLQSFLNTIASNYGAGIRQVDFINRYEAVRTEINSWVSDQTQGKIKDLIPAGVLSTDTRMALVNAIYFKASWLNPFEVSFTKDLPFHLLDSSEVSVPAMSQEEFMPYTKGDGWQAIELAYQGGTAAMDIIVPDDGRFEEIDSSLNQATAFNIVQSFSPTTVRLTLPKFKFESEFGLADQLAALGMKDAFDRQKANFSGMTENKNLYISAVLHKAFIAVDEKGTEAAAATGVVMMTTSAHISYVTLNVDRPFIFIIRDIPSGQILFIGRVLNPAL